MRASKSGTYRTECAGVYSFEALQNGRPIGRVYKAGFTFKGTRWVSKDFSDLSKAKMALDVKRLELGLKPLYLKKLLK